LSEAIEIYEELNLSNAQWEVIYDQVAYKGGEFEVLVQVDAEGTKAEIVGLADN